MEGLILRLRRTGEGYLIKGQGAIQGQEKKERMIRKEKRKERERERKSKEGMKEIVYCVHCN